MTSWTSTLRLLTVPPHPKGYPSVAGYISSSPDLAVFRKFSTLNAINLLNMQTELMILEAELKEIDTNDDQDSNKRDRLRSWHTMRDKLEEYNNALIRYSQVLALEEPPRRVLKALNGWMNKGGHPATRPLIDVGDEYLNHPCDLMALSGMKAAEAPETPSPVFYYSEDKINQLSNFIALMLAVCLLIGAIASLYYVRTEGLRLGMISVYILLFAAGLSLTTSGKKGEVFGATAAYAAVLVVYISRNGE
ncbi:hypothetical protein BDD12DRAFT_881154 [Trichophaea hybrida]|nr:hypothetical protein BDD12DRAFT_881154 [Trichophaea hybrida]